MCDGSTDNDFRTYRHSERIARNLELFIQSFCARVKGKVKKSRSIRQVLITRNRVEADAVRFPRKVEGLEDKEWS